MARVELTTTEGSITLELDEERAPVSSENFLRYVEYGHYAGTIFHRVIDGFMVQGGGYDAALAKRPTRPPIRNEADNGLKNKTGTVAMARTSEVDSATAQFFINVADNAFLDHQDSSPRGFGYAVFGTVVEGMDVVNRIKSVATGAKGPFSKDCPMTDVVIESASRVD